MDEENSSSLSEMLKTGAQRVFKIVGDIAALASTEAKLASNSAGTILLLFFISGSLLTVTWICLMALIAAGLLAWHVSLVGVAAILTGINIFLLLLLALKILSLRKNLFFSATCRQLKKIKNSS
jgi:hypothetical protein